MTVFETRYFQKINFDEDQVRIYLNNCLKDIKIAEESLHNEVRFNYSYRALIKAGIALIAKIGGVKVRGIPGHHIKEPLKN
ncbi:hypothetical protein KKA47_07325 [bacterium]|nr:hypothetical protein [bacterium]